MVVKTRRLLALTALALLPGLATAHHSVAEFDMAKRITVDAVVKEVWFSNPHIRYYVAAKNNAGVEEIWDVHGSSVTSLARRGWVKNTIKVGDKIKVTGSPARDGAKRLLISTVTLSDGTVLGGTQSSNADANKERATQ